MTDLNQLAADLSALAKEDVHALGEILKNDYNSAVKVIHDDLLGNQNGAAPADSTGPGTGPGH